MVKVVLVLGWILAMTFVATHDEGEYGSWGSIIRDPALKESLLDRNGRRRLSMKTGQPIFNNSRGNGLVTIETRLSLGAYWWSSCPLLLGKCAVIEQEESCDNYERQGCWAH